MKFGFRLHLVELSFSDIILLPDILGFELFPITVHNWMQMADLQSLDGASPDKVAVDETVIQLNDCDSGYMHWSPRREPVTTLQTLSDKNKRRTEVFLSELPIKSSQGRNPSSRFCTVTASGAHRHDFDTDTKNTVIETR
jgi:transposase-like protein